MTDTRKALLEVQNVHRAFGDLKVLEGISMSITEGTILCLLGPSGSGKTTFVRLLAGADLPDQGTVHIDGKLMPSLELLRRIGYMAQSDALYGELSGRENMEFFGGLYDLDRKTLHDRIDRYAELVGLTDALDRQVQLYSGGMKRRLSLATTLLHEPPLLFLDEPTVGIDPVLRKSLWAELRSYAEGGRAILITTHVMDEADKCDRVCMLRDGRMIASDSPAGLKAQAGVETMEDAFLHFGVA